MLDTNDHQNIQSVESDSSSSYESYANIRRACTYKSQPLIDDLDEPRTNFAGSGLEVPSSRSNLISVDLRGDNGFERGKEIALSNPFLGDEDDLNWWSADLDKQQSFVLEKGIAKVNPYLIDEESGRKEEFFDELHPPGCQPDKFSYESNVDMWNDSSNTLDYLQDNDAKYTNRRVNPIARFSSSLFDNMTRAEQQRFKRRICRVVVTIIVLILVLGVALGISKRNNDQGPASAVAPPQSQSPTSTPLDVIDLPEITTAPSNVAFGSGQAAHVEAAEKVVDDALGRTSQPTPNPINY